MRVHLAVADTNDESVQDILAEREGFRTDGSGVYSLDDVVFHVVPESYEWGYARRPDICGSKLVVGAVVRNPAESDDYVVVGPLELGTNLFCIIHHKEWRYSDTRRAVNELCQVI